MEIRVIKQPMKPTC